MGGSSPSVFHTAPPQPALKARTTLYSLSAGGAEASQNGFGDAMPAKLHLRSAIELLRSAAIRRRRSIACAAILPSCTAWTVRSGPAMQSPPAHTPDSD